MRRLAALGAIAFLLAGCGGGGGSNNGGGRSASGNPIAQAAAKTSAAGSLKIDFGISSKGLSGGGRGIFNTGKRTTGRVAMTVQSGGQSTTVDTLVEGNVLYIRSPVFRQVLPAGKEWVRLDLAKLAQQRGLNLGSLLDSNPTPTGALAYLRGSTGTVQKVGTETVQGVKTTHYKATIDLEQAAKRATGPARDSIRRVINVAGVRRLPVEVWVDGNGYVRKLIYTQHSGRGQSAKIEMELHDFGTPVAVLSPPASSVVEFQELLKPQGG